LNLAEKECTMKKIATTLLALTLAALAAGCNTVQGVGQDIEKAGGAIKRAAQ
jgi:predicted small secreted protein